jgi:hypothetical protein
MAKRTNGGPTRTTAGGNKAKTAESTARRAPARRRTDKKSSADAPVTMASDTAQGEMSVATAASALAGQSREIGFAPSSDEVRRRAYEIYVNRGCTNGSDVEDWLEAERQLRETTHRGRTH